MTASPQVPGPRGTPEPGGDSAFEAWVKQSAAFISTSTNGWKTPAVSVEPGARLEPDGSVLLVDPANKQQPAGTRDQWTFRMKPGAIGLARIRLELLPHSAHGGKITRDQAESASIQLSASVRSPRSPQAGPLAFFLAEADLEEPRYFNGYETTGILEGWRTAKDHPRTAQTAIWCLDTPVALAADDELTIVVRTDRAGCVRLSALSLRLRSPRPKGPG